MDYEIQKKWEALHKEARFRPKYPNETVVQFVFRNFKRDGSAKVLDLGCGAGRHMFFMARENVDAYGMDLSQEGVEYTRKCLEEWGLRGEVKAAGVDSIPYEDNFFDGIICYGVLYYCTKTIIEKAVEEIYRVMKPGAKGLVLVRDIEDYRFGKGRRIEKNTFIVEERDVNKSSFNENGMTMHFFERSELEELFNRFENVIIDRITETHENEKYSDSNYLVTFQKGGADK